MLTALSISKFKIENMKAKLLVVSLLFCNSLIAQVTSGDGFVYSKEFNKDILFSKANPEIASRLE